MRGSRALDGVTVDTVTAFLFHQGGHADPVRLGANVGKSFQGSIVLGMGFTFDDTDKKGVASSLAEMSRLIETNPCNREAILPYIGGEEVNTSPTHAHHRHVINFGERSEEECRLRWPDLLAIVEERVKPKRMTDNRATYRDHWWQYRGEEKRALRCHRRPASRAGNGCSCRNAPYDLNGGVEAGIFSQVDSVSIRRYGSIRSSSEPSTRNMECVSGNYVRKCRRINLQSYQGISYIPLST